MPRVAKTPVYKQFYDSKICWDFNNLPKNLGEMFPAKHQLLVELGAGSCYFSTGFAQKHTDWNVLATDLKRDRLWKGARRSMTQKLTNTRFLNINVMDLIEVLGSDSVDQLWLTFPDPHAKARQAKHRMNQPEFLEVYKSLLRKHGSFNLKTDDSGFFIESIENLQKHGWIVTSLSADLHSDLDEKRDEAIKTRYETEFTEAGLPIYYLSAELV